MILVVDASVAAKWYFDEEHAAAARWLRESRASLVAPALLLAEIGSISWKKRARGEITVGEAEGVVAAMRRADLVWYTIDQLAEGALRVACWLRHSYSDCLYLALAEAVGGRVVTADRRLHAVVTGTPLAGRCCWIEELQ